MVNKCVIFGYERLVLQSRTQPFYAVMSHLEVLAMWVFFMSDLTLMTVARILGIKKATVTASQCQSFSKSRKTREGVAILSINYSPFTRCNHTALMSKNNNLFLNTKRHFYPKIRLINYQNK